MKNFLFLSLLLSFTVMAENKVKVLVSLTPAGSFEAVSEKIKGNLIKTGNTFSADKLWVSIESMKTGIDLRDEHYWKHLNSNKHTKAVITDVKAQGGKGTGVLEVNGVKKPVAITYVEKNQDIVATFKVKASQFNLPKASYMGVGVNDIVQVEVTYPFVVK